MIILNTLRRLLFPFGIIYGVVVYIRNRMFDWGLLRQTSFSIPIIVVGNITVGGTGKTPVTEYLIRHLHNKYKVALLSRGYGRKSKGVIFADDSADANLIGDEPYQIKSKFPNIGVCVAEKRVDGANLLVSKNAELILCDDAFQHRYLKPKMTMVVVDSNRPLWKDCYLPAGELRDSPSELKRANIVLVSKCSKDFCLSDALIFKNKLGLNPQQKLFFSSIKYGTPINLLNAQTPIFRTKQIMALSGIAKPKPFFDYLDSNYEVVDKMSFPDHHNYTEENLTEIAHRLQQINGDIIILTTEKDAARLNIFSNFMYFSKIWFLPIEIEILFEEDSKLKTIIDSYVEEDRGDRSVS